MRDEGVGAPPRGGGQGSVWFAVVAATGGLVIAIATSVVAHDRALEEDPPEAGPVDPQVREIPVGASEPARPDASLQPAEAERALVTRGR
ncbi:MAG: hypothetical protein ACRENE_29115 [Polyangiaceae bacterium]